MQHNITLTEVITPDEFLPLTQKSGLDKATEYAITFAPFMATVKELGQKAAAINKIEPTQLDAKLAREVRLVLVKNRTATGTKKDESKAALLAESNLIQSLHNVVVNSSQIIESELSEVEKYAENKEKERIEALCLSRVELLQTYVDDANIFPLGTMTDDAFTSLVDGQRLAYESKIEAQRLAEEAAIKAEAERIAEQVRIKAENERLKAEQVEAARVAKIEQDKKDAEHKAKLAEIEKENKAARDKADKEQAQQKLEAAKLQAELDAKNRELEAQAAEIEKQRLVQVAADERAKKAALAPKKEKMKLWVDGFILVLPAGLSDDADVKNIVDKFNAFKAWALTQIESI